MKILKSFFSVTLLLAVLLASSLPTCAIGFSAEEVYKSIFVIYSSNSLGSGFALGKNCVITNSHVIENSSMITVKAYDGNEYKARVIGTDEKADIAVLAVENAEFPTLQTSESFNVGDDVYAIGAPKSMEYTLTKGVISAKNRKINNSQYIQIDVAINEGNSGGPLLTNDGVVIGMNTLKLDNSEGIGFAIPIKKVVAYLNTLGIEIDTNGNVKSDISPTETTAPKTSDSQKNSFDNSDKKTKDQKEAFSVTTKAAVATAAVSLILNIILVIMLFFQKKKNLNIKYDPKERTDFEIDILE